MAPPGTVGAVEIAVVLVVVAVLALVQVRRRSSRLQRGDDPHDPSPER